MSLGIVMELKNTATPRYRRVREAMSRGDVRKVMGRGIATSLRQHFTKLDRERPNALGGKRTHFYGQTRRGVQQPELVGGDGVKVAINQVGLGQRRFGGDIERDDGGLLSIPVHPAAHGKRAREFDDLDAIYFDDGTGILAMPNDEPGKLGEVYYRLVRKVHQEPDPTVLPTDAELQEAAVAAASDYLDQRANS